MPTTNYVVSGLTAYVEQNRDLILKNFALVGTDTRRRIGIQTGVKGSAHLHYLDIAPTLQSGEGCGFSAAGTATISEKTIATAMIKVNLDICDKLLVGKYAEYLVRINATIDELPYEQYLIDGLVNEINKKIEKYIWQGDTTSASTDLKWINGFLKQFAGDGTVLTESIASGSSAYAGIMQVYASMPEEALERGGLIFVSPAIYKAFIMDLVALNYYHYAGPNAAYPDEFYLPGSDVKVVKTPGLSGSLKIVGTFGDNLVYGCDMEGDEEDVKVWFSDDDDVWKLKVLWNSGVAYHFGNQVVLGTFAAAPSALAPLASVMNDVHDTANHAITTKASA